MLKKCLLFCMPLVLMASEYNIQIIGEDGIKRDTENKSIDMSLYQSSNLSRKSISSGLTNCKGNYNLYKNDKAVIVKSDKFGPLPVTLLVKDTNGKTILEEVNGNSLLSQFQIPLKVLQNNFRIEVENAFGDKLMCKNFKY